MLRTPLTVRITAAEKYMFIKELLDSNMMFRILHNNLDQMVADSVHKVFQNESNSISIRLI